MDTHTLLIPLHTISIDPFVNPNLGEAQLGHQASAEYKLTFCLGLRDVYFTAVYSAGSETERVVLKKRSETQNRSTFKLFKS